MCSPPAARGDVGSRGEAGQVAVNGYGRGRSEGYLSGGEEETGG